MTDVVAEELGRPIPVMDAGVTANREGSIGYPENEEMEEMTGEEEGGVTPRNEFVSQQESDGNKEEQLLQTWARARMAGGVGLELWVHAAMGVVAGMGLFALARRRRGVSAVAAPLLGVA